MSSDNLKRELIRTEAERDAAIAERDAWAKDAKFWRVERCEPLEAENVRLREKNDRQYVRVELYYDKACVYAAENRRLRAALERCRAVGGPQVDQIVSAALAGEEPDENDG